MANSSIEGHVASPLGTSETRSALVGLSSCTDCSTQETKTLETIVHSKRRRVKGPYVDNATQAENQTIPLLSSLVS